MWTGEISIRRVSVLFAWLPRGSRCGQMIGGVEAVTRETEAIMGLETTMLGIHWSNTGRKGKQPTGRDFPLGAEEAKKKASYTERNAQAWRRKYGNRKTR